MKSRQATGSKIERDRPRQQFTVLTSIVAGLHQFMRHRGYECGTVFDGMPPPASNDPTVEPVMPLERGMRMFDEAARVSGRPALGVEFARAMEVGGTGALGFAITNAKTVRDALKITSRFVPLVVSMDISEFEETPEFGAVIWRYPVHPSVPRFQLASFGASSVIERLRPALPPGLLPTLAEFDDVLPGDIAELRAFFGPGLAGGKPINRFSLPAPLLDLPMPGANPQLLAVVTKLAEIDRRHRGIYSSSFEESARVCLSKLIKDGQPRLEDLAKELNINVTRLQSNLRANKLNFKILLDEVRRDAALAYLRETTIPITAITLMLGYADTSIFTRACHKWFGQTPTQVRMAAQSPPP